MFANTRLNELVLAIGLLVLHKREPGRPDDAFKELRGQTLSGPVVENTPQANVLMNSKSSGFER